MKTSLEDESVQRIFRNSAWKYFTVHAGQRLKLFQFYITISTAMLAAASLLVRIDEPGGFLLLAILGSFAALVSFIFWKLDLRTRTLVKQGEEALRILDNLHEIPNLQGPSPLKLFEREEYLVKKKANSSPIMGHYSCSRCFEWPSWLWVFWGSWPSYMASHLSLPQMTQAMEC